MFLTIISIASAMFDYINLPSNKLATLVLCTDCPESVRVLERINKEELQIG